MSADIRITKQSCQPVSERSKEAAGVPLARKRSGAQTLLATERINHGEPVIGINEESGQVIGKDLAELLADHKAKQAMAMAMEGFLERMEAAACGQNLDYSFVSDDPGQQRSLGEKRLAPQMQL